MSDHNAFADGTLQGPLGQDPKNPNDVTVSGLDLDNDLNKDEKVGLDVQLPNKAGAPSGEILAGMYRELMEINAEMKKQNKLLMQFFEQLN
jgi:hypothetical protein